MFQDVLAALPYCNDVAFEFIATGQAQLFPQAIAGLFDRFVGDIKNVGDLFRTQVHPEQRGKAQIVLRKSRMTGIERLVKSRIHLRKLARKLLPVFVNQGFKTNLARQLIHRQVVPVFGAVGIYISFQTIEQLIFNAQEAGALGAKICGAGGGGCLV